jgi:hypothetical protein
VLLPACILEILPHGRRKKRKMLTIREEREKITGKFI